jgi:copper chaperone NosL
MLTFIGCGATELNPPTIETDRTACEKCRMLISESQYAAAYFDGVGTDGYHIIDDIGCMVRKLKAATPKRTWVHDLASNAWVEADSATFVYSSHITTPMSYGYVAFRSRQAAEAYAAEHQGHVLASLSEVVHSMEDLAK